MFEWNEENKTQARYIRVSESLRTLLSSDLFSKSTNYSEYLFWPWDETPKKLEAVKLTFWLSHNYENTENDRRMSFDIKFTRQDFENACWITKLCWAIQHTFSKPSLVTMVNLTSKDVNLVFYLSVYSLVHSSFWRLCCLKRFPLRRHPKSPMPCWPYKGSHSEIYRHRLSD